VRGQGAQPGVVVTQRELVERPLPAAAGGGVAAEELQGVVTAVRGEVAEDGEGEPGALLVGAQHVVGGEEVVGEGVHGGVQLQAEPGVIERAVLHLPVVPGVVDHALVQRLEGFCPRRGECVQGPVASASLEEAEEGAAGRYGWLEHDVSIRCGGTAGNGIFRGTDRPGHRPAAGSIAAAAYWSAETG
jgi:hypothetical protein